MVTEWASILCPVRSKFERIPLSRRNTVQLFDSISDKLTEQLKTVRKDFVWFSLALDTSTDNEKTAQVFIFICWINENFVSTEELLGLESMKDRTTGQDLLYCTLNYMEKRGLNVEQNSNHYYWWGQRFQWKNISMVKLLKKQAKL